MMLISTKTKHTMKNTFRLYSGFISTFLQRKPIWKQAPVVENAVDNAESSVSGAIKKIPDTPHVKETFVHEIYQELIKMIKIYRILIQNRQYSKGC